MKAIVLSIVRSLSKSCGGPSYSVVNLCEATARQGVFQCLASVKPNLETTEILPNPDLVQTIFIGEKGRARFSLPNFVLLETELRKFCRSSGINLIHNHGLWLLENHAAARLARSLEIPLIVSTHGMLSPWAWRYRAWKKRPAWWIYQKRDLQLARVIRATSAKEVDEIRRVGICQPIAMIPNGVYLPQLQEQSNAEGMRIVLFVGRIHRVKGLLNLVRAWTKLRPKNWRCIICGPDEGGYQKEVESAISAAGLKDSFAFIGPMEGEAKWKLYQKASIVVLPSFTENFGLVVAEALACGVPVITTKGTPWSDLVSDRCGWWIDIGWEPLFLALSEVTLLSAAQLREMGLNGRRLIEKRYTWSKVGADIVSLYEWVLCGGPPPGCLVVA